MIKEMLLNSNSVDLTIFVQKLRESGREGSYWDFKKAYSSKKVKSRKWFI